jgi:hypothetical protein
MIKGTAELALTSWSRRKFSRKVRSQVLIKLEVQKEGQLSGHSHPGVVENSSKEQCQISDKYKAGQQKGTAERALTSWNRRKIKHKKVRSKVSNKLEVQQEGQLSGHLQPGVVERSNTRK